MHLVDEGLDRGIGGAELGRQRMIGRECDEARAEDGVGARREHLDRGRGGLAAGHQLEQQPQAIGFADPVALHGADLVRPVGQPVERLEQVLGIVRNLQEPLRQLALLDDRTRAPAAAVDHLLVGEHGLVDRVPVDLGGLARHQPGLEEIEEQLLLALVVVDVAGGEFARPVEAQPHRLELLSHRVDVGVGPGLGVAAGLLGGVLGGQAKGVPAHRMQDIQPPRAFVAGQHVTHRIVADVPHVDAPRGVGEHLEHVVALAGVVLGDHEGLLVLPGFLPARLLDTRVVALDRFGHFGWALKAPQRIALAGENE